MDLWYKKSLKYADDPLITKNKRGSAKTVEM